MTKSNDRQAMRDGKATNEPTLPDSELEVLRVLWSLGQATARQVLEALREAGSRWTYATVNTLLQRLETKGLARSDKSRMRYVYRPTISRGEVSERRVNSIVEKLYDGRGGMLVLHLLKTQKLSADEMAQIRDYLTDVAPTDDT